MVQQSHAQQVEHSLNLKRQSDALREISDSEIIFQETGPPKRWDIVYSTQTGEPVRVARHRLEHVLNKVLPDGSPAFTAYKENAPAYQIGNVPCFLARNSKDRAEVDAMGLSNGYYCPAEHLASDYAAKVHAEHKHPTRWRMWQDHIFAQEREEEREERRQQTEAMLAMAGRAAGVDTPDRPRRGRPPKED